MKSIADGAAFGTLPLVAAMIFGILVSIIAVIAFLQMTSRGKESGEARDERPNFLRVLKREEDGEWSSESQPPSANLSLGHTANLSDGVSDFTVPLMFAKSLHPAVAVQAKQGEPQLCGIAGEFEGSQFLLTQQPLAMGRDRMQCGLVYPDHMSEISRKHCTISYDAERSLFLLVDQGSSNGTFLADGRQVQAGQRCELRAGERFHLSGEQQVFEVRC